MTHLRLGEASAIEASGDPDPAFQTETVRTIGDVATLRALSDPLRLRILETMVQRTDDPWSVKELAAALSVPQTRLYHHVEQLVEHDLVRPVERRVVSGIIETRYRVVARSFQLDRRLLAGDSEESRSALHETLVSIFDSARHEIEVAIHLGAIDVAEDAPPERRLLLSRGVVQLAPARVQELRERLVALVGEFESEPEADSAAFGLVLALYPMAPSGGRADASGEATPMDADSTSGPAADPEPATAPSDAAATSGPAADPEPATAPSDAAANAEPAAEARSPING
jgi:DNA-binding transcriptional ArsR family regulator